MVTPISSQNKNDGHQDRFSLIYLNSNLQDNLDIEQKLESIINNFNKFEDVEQCQQYIQQTSSTDQLILILNSQLGKQLISSIHQLQQVISIYIYCPNTELNKEYFSKYSKIREKFTNVEEIISKIRYDHRIEKRMKEPLTINIFSSDGQSTTQLNGRFVFFQVLIDCLLRLKSNEADKNELIKIYQNAYQGKTNDLKNIDEFQKNYSAETSIWWYTRESFFYQTLNAALRSENIHMMYLLRSFIVDIQQQLQKYQCKDHFKVYRSQIMSTDEFQKFRQSKSQLISVNSFFSTSLDRSSTIFRLGEGNNSVDWERILFEIDADPKKTKTKPFADISQLSYFPNEDEILFMTGSIFRIKQIVWDANHFWIVRMTLCDDDEHHLKDILEDMKKQVGKGETNLRTLAKILWEIGELDSAERYFERLLDELSSNDPLLVDLYDDLAKLTSQMKNSDKSMKWRQKLLAFKEQNRFSLSNMSTVNSIRIQKCDLTLSNEIGHGGFGRIYRAKWLINDDIVAVKVLHPTYLNNETRQVFFNELSILNSIRHPNIITYYGACLNEDWLALIMEYMPLGSLYQLLHEQKVNLSWSNQLSIALQTLKGINYLHRRQRPILHRDIKSSNLLLENHDKGYLVKVCDFGMAKTRNETTRQTKEIASRVSTAGWAAPEIWYGEPYTVQSDIYSLGTVYWEITSNQIPYNDWEEFAIRASVISGERLKITDNTRPNFRSIIQKCWIQKPEDRPTSVDLLKMINECIQNQDQKTNIHRFQFKSNLNWNQNAQTIAGGNGQGNKLNQLCFPHGIYVDYQQQSIYIAEWGNHRIVKWKLGENNGQIVAGGDDEGNRIDQLNCPSDVIVDENNKSLIICDFGNRRVIRWSLENTNDKQIIINNIKCSRLTMNENGDLFVSDEEKHEVKRWRKGEKEEEGTVVAGGNGCGDKLNQLNEPTFLFIDREETIYVSDWKNHRVMKWCKDAKEGIIVAGGQGKGNRLNQLSYPQGLMVNEIGDVYVADWRNDRIMCWSLGSKEGRIVIGGDSYGNASNQLNHPTGLSVDVENNLYVVDWGNDRIQRFHVGKPDFHDSQ